MSGPIFTGATGFTITQASDCRLLEEQYADDSVDQLAGVLFNASDFLGVDDFWTPWWPGTAGVWSVSALGREDTLAGSAAERVYPVGNGVGRFAFAGVTRDRYGQPVGNATVRCFRASTGELVSQVTSDANGVYLATTPYASPEQHFLTVHAGGTVGGASLDTLVPS